MAAEREIKSGAAQSGPQPGQHSRRSVASGERESEAKARQLREKEKEKEKENEKELLALGGAHWRQLCGFVWMPKRELRQARARTRPKVWSDICRRAAAAAAASSL